MASHHHRYRPFFSLISLLITLLLSPATTADSIIQLPRKSRPGHRDHLYCESWKFAVEANDAGTWKAIPGRCEDYVMEYMTDSNRYGSDSEIVADFAIKFARTVEIADDGMDAWVFDVDETLLSNLPYYETHGYGSEVFNEESFDRWVYKAEGLPLPSSLRLYNELKELGFKIFLLTGRDEDKRRVTVENLHSAGYYGWERLILRGPRDRGTKATVFKSRKRQELKDEGYRIHGSSGDQWSDLQGFAKATRSFKLPNPMYYIP